MGPYKRALLHAISCLRRLPGFLRAFRHTAYSPHTKVFKPAQLPHWPCALSMSHVSQRLQTCWSSTLSASAASTAVAKAPYWQFAEEPLGVLPVLPRSPAGFMATVCSTLKPHKATVLRLQVRQYTQHASQV